MVASRRVDVALVRVGFISVLRVLFVGFACVAVPAYLLSALLALVGMPLTGVTVDGAPVTGLPAALVLLGWAIAAPFALTFLTGMPLWVGLWVFARLRPWLGPLHVEAMIEDEAAAAGKT